MTEAAAWDLVQLGAIALMGWFLIFIAWVPYCRDRLRDDLLTVRRKLFWMGTSGEIAFDHPAYLQLWNTMNGYLRTAHRVSFFAIIMTLLCAYQQVRDGDRPIGKAARDWERPMQSLPVATRNRLGQLHQQMHFAILIHSGRCSPVALFGIPLFILARALPRAVQAAYIRMKPSLWSLDSAAAVPRFN